MTGSRTVANDVLIGQVCALLAEGKRVKLRAKGESMRPFIKGDEDTLLLVPPGAVRRGDVVLALTDEGSYVVHRVTGIKGDLVLLRGDGNLFRCETCPLCRIYGIVEAVVREGRERSMTASAPRMLASGWRMLLPLRRLWWRARYYGTSLVKH